VLRAGSRENTKSEFNECYEIIRSRLANLERTKYRRDLEIQLDFSGLIWMLVFFSYLRAR